MEYKSTGKLFVGNDGSVKLLCDKGLLDYYKRMIEKRFWITTQFPKHGPHISIILPRFNRNIDLRRFNKYRGKVMEFQYDPYVHIGGHGKGYRTFWLKVNCPAIDKIKKEFNINDGRGYLGLHLTICNTKNQ